MGYLPSNFIANITELSNYSKNPIRVTPISGQGAVRSNGFIKFQLPIALLDMRTFAMFFDAKTLVGGTDTPANQLVGFPKFIGPSLIETLDVWINGQNAQSIPQYGRIYAFMQNYKNNYNSQVKKLQTNADPSVIGIMNEEGVLTKYNTYQQTGNADAGGFKGRYVCNDWIGVLDANPSFWDLNVIGNVEIHIKLASHHVLFTDGLGPNDVPDYELSNIVAYVDQIHWNNDRYSTAIKSAIESQEGLQIVFKNYMIYTGEPMTASKQTNLKITENTSCLTKVMFGCWDNTQPNGKQPLQLGDRTKILTAPAAAPAAGTDFTLATATAYVRDNVTTRLTNITNGHIAPSQYNATNLLANYTDGFTNLNNSLYFKQNGLGIGTVQLELNSQDFCPPLTLVEQWQQTLQAFSLNEDDLKQINPAIRDINVYERDFYCCAFSLEAINNKDATLGEIMSGRNLMSSSMNITVKATAGRTWHANQAAVPFIITEMISRLQVTGQGQVLPIR